LDTGELIRKGGASGVILGEDELLLSRITSDDESERMPPEGKPLDESEVDLIRRWIELGAVSPENELAGEDPRQHWSFLPPQRPDLPKVRNPEWGRTPIDRFVLAQMESRNLTPARPAAKEVWLRRVYLDLIGLPPSRDEQAEFLQDDSPQSYSRVVDRLLASSQYGERWGRHWMDIWRYSDWYGRRKVPDNLNSYGQIWRWRDWIVRSLNEGKGYEQMVLEMLAADEIMPLDEQNAVATGFIVRNFYRWNYNNWMKDNVEHTSKAFLGLTLNCCHCHDHKYDPIANEEYFRFRAFFEPIEIRHDRVEGEPDPGVYPKYSYGKAYKAIDSGLVRIHDEKLDAKTYVYTGGEARNIIEGRDPVTAAAPAIVGGDQLVITPVDLPAEVWYPGSRPAVQQTEIAKREQDLVATQQVLIVANRFVSEAEAALAKANSLEGDNATQKAAAESTLNAANRTLKVDQTNVARAIAELVAIRARVDADNIRYKGRAGDPEQATEAASSAMRQAALETAKLELARAERELAAAEVQSDRQEESDKQEEAAKPALAKATARHTKATASVQAAEVAVADAPGDYPALSHQYPRQSTGRRAALARWLASSSNPLTARVAVNHVWNWHFGRGIVSTTENLGRNGARPTHPQLIDWMAVELMENRWDMKHLHRLIVLSASYRQASSHLAGDLATSHRETDPDNVYLWKFPTMRMEAEVLRDSILHVADGLDTTIGGKEIAQSEGLSNGRRSLYFEHHGEGRMSFLDLFDAADPLDCYHRATSVRPQQALAMANSELTIWQARRLARGLVNEFGSGEVASFVAASFRQVLSRRPSPEELALSVEFIGEAERLLSSAKAEELAAGSDPQKLPPSVDPIVRARENFVQALLSHTDFVTIR
jgi:hypothetical protein